MSNLTTSNLLSQVSLDDIRRERARRHLEHFTKYTFPGYVCEPVHSLIASALDGVVAGYTDRLMIFSFPQSGKSELASIRLPAFWFGKHPDDPVILASYGASLAHSKSRQARSIVESTEYEEIFPSVTTNPESRARDNWSIKGYKGEFVAAGVGGPITGHGALLGIIDDPLENWEQAQSETIRDKIWEWYRTTFRTRVWEHGRIVIIMTRWHADDLCGRLLEEQGDDWQVLRLPAIAETQKERDDNNEYLGLPTGQPDPLRRKPGQALCPKRFSINALLELKNDVGSMGWGSQYQGVARLAEGNRFKRGWFEIVKAVPAKFDGLARYWDKAGTQDGGDYTVGILMGIKSNVYYVLNMVRGQWSTNLRETTMLQTAHLDLQNYGRQVKIFHEEEPGSSGKDSARATTTNLAGFPVFSDRVTGPLEIRAEHFASQAEAGNVKLLYADWNRAFINEITGFPNATHDDIVAAASGAFNKMPRKRKAKARMVNLG